MRLPICIHHCTLVINICIIITLK